MASSPSVVARRTTSRMMRLDYAPAKRQPTQAARRAGRQGHHLRHRWAVDQASCRDGDDETRHDRRRRRDRRRCVRCATWSIGVKVTGLVASAENAVGAASMRPGDVVTHYGGRTSEVGNTDAEGRLVLADALAYADRAHRRHLRHRRRDAHRRRQDGAGYVARCLVRQRRRRWRPALADAGDLAGEPVWRLPLVDDYEPLLSNTFADATNAAGGPGAITAALFLQHFAGSHAVGTPRHRQRRRLAGGCVRVLQGRHRLRCPPAAQVAD